MKGLLAICLSLSFLLAGCMGGSNTPRPLPTGKHQGGDNQRRAPEPKKAPPELKTSPTYPSIFVGRWMGAWTGEGGGAMILTFEPGRVSMETHCNNPQRTLSISVLAIVTDNQIEILQTTGAQASEDGQTCRAYIRAGKAPYVIRGAQLFIEGQPTLNRI